jgi:hypothetical protein
MKNPLNDSGSEVVQGARPFQELNMRIHYRSDRSGEIIPPAAVGTGAQQAFLPPFFAPPFPPMFVAVFAAGLAGAALAAGFSLVFKGRLLSIETENESTQPHSIYRLRPRRGVIGSTI